MGEDAPPVAQKQDTVQATPTIELQNALLLVNTAKEAKASVESALNVIDKNCFAGLIKMDQTAPATEAPAAPAAAAAPAAEPPVAADKTKPTDKPEPLSIQELTKEAGTGLFDQIYKLIDKIKAMGWGDFADTLLNPESDKKDGKKAAEDQKVKTEQLSFYKDMVDQKDNVERKAVGNTVVMKANANTKIQMPSDGLAKLDSKTNTLTITTPYQIIEIAGVSLTEDEEDDQNNPLKAEKSFKAGKELFTLAKDKTVTITEFAKNSDGTKGSPLTGEALFAKIPGPEIKAAESMFSTTEGVSKKIDAKTKKATITVEKNKNFDLKMPRDGNVNANRNEIKITSTGDFGREEVIKITGATLKDGLGQNNPITQGTVLSNIAANKSITMTMTVDGKLVDPPVNEIPEAPAPAKKKQ